MFSIEAEPIEPIRIETLSELRNFTPGTLQNPGDVYLIANEILVTFRQEWRNQIFVQDATDGILIDDFSGVVTRDFSIGDGITGLLATLSSHGGALQLVPTENPEMASSTGNQIPQTIITMQEFMDDFQRFNSRLVTIRNVSFEDQGDVIQFRPGRNYIITDGIFRINMRTTFFDVDYIDLSVPKGSFDMTGIVNSRLDGEIVLSFITPRSTYDMGMGVSEDDVVIEPQTISSILGNFPNPFNPSTTIRFTVGAMSSSPVKTGHGDMSPTENVMINVYNMRGQRVRSLVDDFYEPGIHAVVWDGTDDKAQSVASGVYFFVLETSESRHARKAILLK